MQMGSDGFNQILTGFYFFSPAGVRLAPLKTHDLEGFPKDLIPQHHASTLVSSNGTKIEQGGGKEGREGEREAPRRKRRT